MKRILIIIFLLVSVPCQAADFYVKKGAAGTNAGTLANPWNELNQINQASLSAGDTVYIAGGTYTTALAPTASGTSGSRISYKRIRSTDAACSSPCDATWDAQVILDVDNAIQWTSTNAGDGSYVTVDGRIASGIKINGKHVSDNSSGIQIYTECTGIILKNIEYAGPLPSSNWTYDFAGVYVNLMAGRGTGIYSPTFQNLYVHDAPNLFKLFADAPIIDGCTLSGALSPNGLHGNVLITNGITNGLIFRNNDISNWDTEGILIGMTGTPPSMTATVYNNVWHDPAVGYARLVEAQYAEHTLYFYNNTVDATYYGIRTATGGSWSASSKSRNNIFYNLTSYGGLTDSDYNAFSGTTAETNSIGSITSSIFSNYAGHNYILVGGAAAINAGADLSVTFSTDYLGNPRPSGAAWDIGAYEYISQGIPLGSGLNIQVGSGVTMQLR